MRNINLVIDTSLFRPFGYDVANAALLAYNTQYEKLLAVYDKIAQSLGDLSSAVLNTKKAKKIYEDFQNRFNVAAEDFSLGMNAQNAKELNALRRLYGTDIVKLEKAKDLMSKELELRMKDSSALNMLYLNLGTLDNYLDNPDRVLSRYSGTLLTTEAGALAKAASSQMINLENDGLLDDLTKKWLKTKGFKADNVAKTIAEVQLGGIQSITNPIMKNILLNVMDSSGIYNWGDPETVRRGEMFAARGLYAGVGESEVGHYTDELKKMNHQYYLNELHAQNAFTREANKEALKQKMLEDELDKEALAGIDYLWTPDDKGHLKADDVKTVESIYDDKGLGIKAKYIPTKKEYHNLGGKPHSYLSPLKIYKEYLEGLKKLPTYPAERIAWESPIAYSVRARATGEKPKDEDIAKLKQSIKEKYGVLDIFTPELARVYSKYVTLAKKEGLVGYKDDVLKAIDKSFTRNSISYIKDSEVNERVLSLLLANLSMAKEDLVLKVDSQGKVIQSGALSDLLTDILSHYTDNELKHIPISLAYNLHGDANLLLLNTPSGLYSVDAPLFGGIVEQLHDLALHSNIEGLKGKYPILNDKSLSEEDKLDAILEIQMRTLAKIARHLGNNIIQALPKTSSKAD